jgi:hypothetical protein
MESFELGIKGEKDFPSLSLVKGKTHFLEGKELKGEIRGGVSKKKKEKMCVLGGRMLFVCGGKRE